VVIPINLPVLKRKYFAAPHSCLTYQHEDWKHVRLKLSKYGPDDLIGSPWPGVLLLLKELKTPDRVMVKVLAVNRPLKKMPQARKLAVYRGVFYAGSLPPADVLV
jgi:hypothetical protein